MKLFDKLAERILLNNSSKRPSETDKLPIMGSAERIVTRALQKNHQNSGPSLRANLVRIPDEQPAAPASLSREEKEAILLAHLGSAYLDGLTPEQSPFPTFEEQPKNRVNGVEIHITPEHPELFVTQVRLAELPPREQHLVIRAALLDDHSPQRMATNAILGENLDEGGYQEKVDKLGKKTLADLSGHGRLVVAEYAIGHKIQLEKKTI